MLQHRGEPTRTGDSFEEAKIAAFELLAERAEHGQAPRGDALVRCPADKVPANPLRRFKKARRSENVAKFGRRRGGVGGQPQKNFMPPGPLEYPGCLGSTASRRRRSQSSSRALPRVSWRLSWCSLQSDRSSAEEEFLLITFMWLDVVCVRCSIDVPIFQAHLAQWLRT